MEAGDRRDHQLKCPICDGQGWVCENHPQVKWDNGWAMCCDGLGMPCECNHLHKNNRKGRDNE